MDDTVSTPQTRSTTISASKLTGRDSGGSDLGGMGGESKIAKLSRILRTTRVKVNDNEKATKVNAEKITRIKNIIQTNKKNVADQLKAQDNSAVFTEIAGKVQSIADTLEQQQKFDKGQATQSRQQQQKKKATAREKMLESGGGALAAVKGTAEKIASPMQGIFDKLFNFITNVVLGRAIFKMFEWFQDEENKKKVDTIFRFIKDWWPTLLAGLILFGAALLGPAGLIIGITALAIGFIPKLVDATKQMFGFGNDVEKGVKKAESATKDSEKKIGAPKDPNEIPSPDLAEIQQKTQELSGPGETPEKPNGMVKGGMVKGPGGIDNVPAMLTAGEYVISKGAVDKFGSGMFAALNAAGGGSGEPSGGNYSTGGMVFNLNPKKTFNIASPRHYKTGGFVSPRYYKTGGLVTPLKADHLYLKFAEGGHVPAMSSPDPVESTKTHEETFLPFPEEDMKDSGATKLTSFGKPKSPSKAVTNMVGQQQDGPLMNFVKTVKNYFVGSPDEAQGSSMQMSPTQNYKAPRVDPPMAKKSNVVIAPPQQGGGDAGGGEQTLGSKPPAFGARTSGSRTKTQTLGVVV